jgi:lipoprotein-releasing system permease protein
MYKLLLCWRYLKTRYLAMACIISVMLGVATLIVVNSVMSGFSTKLRDRLHGLLSDVVIEAHGMEGFADPRGKMARIRRDPFLGPRVETMACSLEAFAMLQFHYPNGDRVTRPVRLIGVDPAERAQFGGFKDFLMNPANRANPSFELPEEVRKRYQMNEEWRATQADLEASVSKPRLLPPDEPLPPPPPLPPPTEIKIPQGVIVGNLIACLRYTSPDPAKQFEERYVINKGDSVVLTTVGGGPKPVPVYDRFVVVDYFRSEMSDYDSNYVFVSLDWLQHLRTMEDRVTSIQIKLKNYDADAESVVKELKTMFQGEAVVNTWEGKQGALLAAINIEKGILNVLLFLIIAVAGFGILAIFSMIVTEKTRDIGILKALGASNGGVMKIFLSYGLLLGVVGASLGSLLGVLLTENINEVEKWLGQLTGKKLFDPGVYYFTEIPTDIQVRTVLMVNMGAVLIAVLFSVLPAFRAALLHPVRALRYE